MKRRGGQEEKKERRGEGEKEKRRDTRESERVCVSAVNVCVGVKGYNI